MKWAPAHKYFRLEARRFLIPCELSVTIGGVDTTLRVTTFSRGRLGFICEGCGRIVRNFYCRDDMIGCQRCLKLHSKRDIMHRLELVKQRLRGARRNYLRTVNKRIKYLERELDTKMLEKICHLIKNPPKSAG